MPLLIVALFYCLIQATSAAYSAPSVPTSQNLFTGFIPYDSNARISSSGEASTAKIDLTLGPEKSGLAWTSVPAPIKPGVPVWLSYFLRYDEHASPNGFPAPLVVEFFRLQPDGTLLPIGVNENFEFSHGKIFGTAGRRYPYVIDPVTPPNGATHVRVATRYLETRLLPWMREPMHSNWGTIDIDSVCLWQAPTARLTNEWKNSPYGPLLASAENTQPPAFNVAASRENSLTLFSIREPDANFFFIEDAPTPVIKLGAGNLLPITRAVQISATVIDWTGNPVAIIKRDLALASFQTKNLDIPIEHLPKLGAYYIQLDATDGGQACTSTSTRFAWLHRPHRSEAVRHNDAYPFDMHPTAINADAEGMTDHDDLDFQLRLMKLMGVRGIRLQSRYYGLDLHDAAASIAAARNKVASWRANTLPVMRKYGIEGWVSFIEQNKGWAPHTPAELEVWRRYNYEQVRDFGTDVSFFIFGNEGQGQDAPNDPDALCRTGWDGTTRQWMAAYQVAYEAAKEASPTCLFGPGEAGDHEGKVARAFHSILGSAGKFEIWAFNGYGNPVQQAGAIHQEIITDGYSPSFGVIPETGIDVPPTGAGRIEGEQHQASGVVRTYLDVLGHQPWIKRIDWFMMQGASTGVEHYNIFTSDWTPRPAAAAYTVLTDILGAGHVENIIDVPGGGEFYAWRKIDGTLVGIGWSDAQKTITLDTGVKHVVVSDIFGNRQTRATASGLIALTLSSSPCYLVGPSMLEKSNAIDVSIHNATETSDGPSLLSVTIRNNTDLPQAMTVLSNGIDPTVAVSPSKTLVKVKPHKTASTSLAVNLLRRDDRVRSTIGLAISNAEGLSFGFRAADTFARCVHAAPGFLPDGTWRGWEQADLLHADTASQVEEPTDTRWKGPDDVSATIRTMWDVKYFYVGVETRDDVFSSTHPPSTMFLSDSIEIGFDLEHRLASDSVLWQFGAGSSTEGDALYRYQPPPSKEIVADSRHLIVRPTGVAAGRIYQVAIPWFELGDYRPSIGKQIGFGVIVDDSDGYVNDRKFISWFGSGISSKHPNELGDLIFVNAGPANVTSPGACARDRDAR